MRINLQCRFLIIKHNKAIEELILLLYCLKSVGDSAVFDQPKTAVSLLTQFLDCGLSIIAMHIVIRG